MCIEIAPVWPTGYSRKGFACSHLKQYTAAKQAFQKCLEIEPENRYAISELEFVSFCLRHEKILLNIVDKNRAELFNTKKCVAENVLFLSSTEFLNKLSSMTMEIPGGAKQGIAAVQIDNFGKLVRFGVPSSLVPGDMGAIDEINKGKRKVGFIVAMVTISVITDVQWFWRNWKNQSSSPSFVSKPLSPLQNAVIDMTLEDLRNSTLCQIKL